MSAKRCRKRFAISRQNRTIIVLLCLLIALIVGWLDRTNARPPHAPQTKTVSKVKPGDIEKYQGKTFTVVYTVDGDTIDINMTIRESDFGESIHLKQRHPISLSATSGRRRQNLQSR